MVAAAAVDNGAIEGAEDQVDPFSMSDEDFLKHSGAFGAPQVVQQEDDTPAPAQQPPATAEGKNDEQEELTGGATEDGASEAQADFETEEGRAEEEEEREEDDGKSEGAEEAGSGDVGKNLPPKGQEQKEGKAEASEEGPKKENEQPPAVNYETEYKNLLAPFKANGKDMQVSSVDDARRLMQMGANYSKKMAGLKPSMKILKMLEKSDLLSEEKLSYLIDLNEGNPEAVAKLLKDREIDPMELDLEGAEKYAASDRSVDEREVELDSVLEDLKESPHYTRTLKIVTQQWDAASKQIVADLPQLLTVIDGHLASGVYDLISTEVEKERMFGRLTDVSDVEAYRLTGDRMNEEGAFNNLGQNPAPVKPPRQTPAAKTDKTDEERKAKRRAASPTKPTASPGVEAQYNPLSMSDEEFEKQANSRLI
jgi:hypothetical protein